LASEETDDIAASLGLTPAEFNVFVEGVHEYFGNRFPIGEFPIVYTRLEEMENEPGLTVIMAEARFMLPPPSATFGFQAGEVYLIAEPEMIPCEDIQARALLQVETRNVEVDGDPDPEFIIYWRYDDFPDETRADQFVNMVETAAEIAWNTICGNSVGEWGFSEFIDNDGVIDIYINDNVHMWGPYPADIIVLPINPWTFNFYHPIKNEVYIYINHNLEQYLIDHYNIEYPAEQDLILNSISHEFFHTVQRAYRLTESDKLWVLEGTAMLVQTAINPAAEFYTPQSATERSYYIYRAVEYLENPEETLEDKSYAACIYWRYLYEHYGGMTIIKAIFDQLEDDNANVFEEEVASINAVLGTTDIAFVDFALANYLEFSSNPSARDNEYYEHSTCYYEDAALVHNKTYEYKGKAMSIDGLFGDTKVRSYAANYIESISKQTENNNVQIVFSGNKDTTFVRRIIAYNNTYPQGEIIDFPQDSIVVPYPNDFDRITIVITNTGHTGNGDYWVLLRPMKDIDAILDFDRSGSMSGSKIAGAKTAAKMFIDILEKPSGWWIFKTDRDKVGLVSFATSAILNLHLTSDFATAKSIINGFVASGNTNMGDALTKSINELNTNSRDATIPAIIYLTDGQTNTGLSKQQILNTLVPQAVNAGIFIYTLGYGSDADPAFLSQVASAGNGKYYFAPDAATLRQVYIDLSHTTKGWEKIASFSGTVSQGQTKTVGVLNILPGTNLFKVLLSWGGSDLDLILIDPTGNPAAPGPGVIYSGNTAITNTSPAAPSPIEKPIIFPSFSHNHPL
ncbi:MAG: VWA domain-containing protein, partial [Dehalococcoidia bacterium]|nr:VWA domain-containing protein [Dehalococcoidia bacterium]